MLRKFLDLVTVVMYTLQGCVYGDYVAGIFTYGNSFLYFTFHRLFISIDSYTLNNSRTHIYVPLITHISLRPIVFNPFDWDNRVKTFYQHVYNNIFTNKNLLSQLRHTGNDPL